jgi:triacylglycerol lipase
LKLQPFGPLRLKIGCCQELATRELAERPSPNIHARLKFGSPRLNSKSHAGETQMRSYPDPTFIQEQGEEPLVFYSEVRGPIAQMKFLPRALLMAELSMIAYNDEVEASRAARAIGFPETVLIDQAGSEAYRFRNAHDVVLACRGTQPNEWNDIEADANAALSLVGTFGYVHSGFKQAVDELWPYLEDLLRYDDRPVWFCGHSLGAAMATICAFRCRTSALTSNPMELHTFGSPRVGCRRYVKHAELSHFRWVHNNDIVTRVPPTFMRYRHGGKEVYLNRNGKICKLKGTLRSLDRWCGFLRGLLKFKLDFLSDHSIHRYAQHLAAAVQSEAGGATFARTSTPSVRRLPLTRSRAA